MPCASYVTRPYSVQLVVFAPPSFLLPRRRYDLHRNSQKSTACRVNGVLRRRGHSESCALSLPPQPNRLRARANKHSHLILPALVHVVEICLVTTPWPHLLSRDVLLEYSVKCGCTKFSCLASPCHLLACGSAPWTQARQAEHHVTQSCFECDV